MTGQDWRCEHCGAAGYEAPGSKLLERCPTCGGELEPCADCALWFSADELQPWLAELLCSDCYLMEHGR